jgi:hypothetical protein
LGQETAIKGEKVNDFLDTEPNFRVDLVNGHIHESSRNFDGKSLNNVQCRTTMIAFGADFLFETRVM